MSLASQQSFRPDLVLEASQQVPSIGHDVGHLKHVSTKGLHAIAITSRTVAIDIMIGYGCTRYHETCICIVIIYNIYIYIYIYIYYF